jgi:hypothetical protein
VALSADKARVLAGNIMDHRNAERAALDRVRRYWKGRQPLLPVLPTNTPEPVKALARIARVNVCGIVVDTLAQSTFVEGYRASGDAENSPVWQTWQANRLDARQTGLHRATFAYGAAYTVVLPGDPLPVIRRRSPRNLTALYGEDEDWPIAALEDLGFAPNGTRSWRMLDEQSIYYFEEASDGRLLFLSRDDHRMGVTPVVRFLDEDDLDAEDEPVPADYGQVRPGEDLEAPARGQIAPLTAVQDQIDVTTFGLLVAQWYSAFRQRYAIGWVADDEKKKAQASASQLWTFDKPAQGENAMSVGEFGQTDLSGYIRSREASLRHAATLSQTPVHELIGELVNLSAEALAAAEAGKDRKVDERKVLLGESHEQTFELVAGLTGETVSEDAQVIWRDTTARSFGATVDALGKLTQMLGIPPQELWERVPGASQQDVERWRKAQTDEQRANVAAAAALRTRAGDFDPAAE